MLLLARQRVLFNVLADTYKCPILGSPVALSWILGDVNARNLNAL